MKSWATRSLCWKVCMPSWSSRPHSTRYWRPFSAKPLETSSQEKQSRCYSVSPERLEKNHKPQLTLMYHLYVTLIEIGCCFSRFVLSFLLTVVCPGAHFSAAERGLSLFSPETYRYIRHDGCAVKTYQLRGAAPSPT